jgi:predicted nucleic acid-binding protein
LDVGPVDRSPPAVDRFELGPGESAALAIALQTTESLVLLDDAAARAAAKQLGLSTTGTLGILLLGKENHLVAEVGPVLATLEQRGFRITETIRSHVLHLAGE